MGPQALNLLKKILASTLGFFQEQTVTRPVAHAGRGGCMGRSFALVRVGCVFIIVGLIVTLTGCSSGSPTNATSFPVPASIGLSPATAVSLDTGSTTQTFTASPRAQRPPRSRLPLHSSPATPRS